MLRYFSVFIVLIVTLADGTAWAQGKRVALVIGNGDYKAAGKLKNPINDADLIASALTTAKFQTVETTINLGIAEFRQALRRFQADAIGAEVALIYYAGHGLEANGVNWLVPTDAELANEGDLEYEAIRIDLALRALAGARMRLLILDACRNNPLARSWTTASRSVERGLRPVEADDVLVLFAAAPGRVASDGVGANSPFAMAMAKWLPEPGLALQLLGGRVRDDVLEATRGNQRPYLSASVTGEPFYLVPIAPAPPADLAGKAMEEAFWNAVKDGKSAELLRGYLERFPDGANVDGARSLLAQIENEAQAALEITRRETELKKAETARQEAERRAAEASLSAELREAREEVKAARDALLAAEKAREAARDAADVARKAEAETLKHAEDKKASVEPVRAIPDGQPEELFSARDREQVELLARKHKFVLPPFTIYRTEVSVPERFRRFVGVWLNESGAVGNTGKGRRHMIIVTQVDSNGRVSGYVVIGPPDKTSFDQAPAHFLVIDGQIEGDAFRYQNASRTWNYRTALQRDGKLMHVPLSTKGLTSTYFLNVVWRLIDAERRARP